MALKLQVTNEPPDKLHPAEWNVRTGHDIQGIAESIAINGFRDPIEAWRTTGDIVAGEGRWRAATEVLGLTSIPVIWHDFPDLAAAKTYALASNALTDRSVMDLPRLADTLGELPSLAGTGIESETVERLAAAMETAAAAARGETPRVEFRAMGKPVVKVVLATEQVSLVEQAIAAADGKTRGDRLATICKAYLGDRTAELGELADLQ